MNLENDDKKIHIALKDFTIEEMNELISKLTAYRNKAKKTIKSRMDKQKRLLEFMQLNDIDSDIIIEKSKRKFTRAPKYTYTTKDGKIGFWAGVGRKPLPIQEHIDKGGKLEDFLIEK